MRATIDDLDDVAGVGETRARAIKEGLSRLAETSHPRPLHLSRSAGSAGSAGELLAVEDAVAAVGLVDPAEAHEAGDGLVDPLAGGADHAGQLLLGDRQQELVLRRRPARAGAWRCGR